MPRLRGGTAILAVMLLGAVAAAEPAPIDRAKLAIDASDYMAARTALADALAAGTNSPDQLAEVYRLSGVVAGALGDTKAAQDAFTRCLLLAPNASLPAGTSPKIARPFTAAQDFMKAREPLRIKTETQADPPVVTVVVASDPLAMIAKLRVTVIVDARPEQVIDRVVAARVGIELPKGQRLDLRVAALDDKGNRLVELGSADVPIVIVGAGGTGTKPAPIIKRADPVAKPSPLPAKQRPLYLRWWLWGGAAIVIGGAGAYFGIDALIKKGEIDDLNAESSNHSFDEPLAIEKQARRSVLFANIGLVTGGVLAAGATVLYLIRPRARPTERRVTVTPVVHGSGGGLVLGGDF